MKKVIFTLLILGTMLWAGEEKCNIPPPPPPDSSFTYDVSLLPGSCQQIGYVCNLGFNVVGENSMMFFNLGADTTCSILLKSEPFKTKKSLNSDSLSTFSNFTLIENQEKMGPLSLTLASSLAMLAINNNMPVDIIYKQVDSIYFNGIKLLSIKLLNINGTTKP